MLRKLDCKMLGPQIRERARRERSRGTKKIKENSKTTKPIVVKVAKNPWELV